MNDLLALAIEAHGGLERWNAFQTLDAKMSITGAVWDFKQVPGMLLDKTYRLKTHEEHLIIEPFPSAGRRSVFTADLLREETLDGALIQATKDPESAFDGHTPQTPWNAVHVAYFSSEALWTYLTSPFLYTYPGFKTEEIEPWHENGETWRRLKVTFPEGTATHHREQVTHFGPDGLMRRHDYVVDVLQGGTGANYTFDYREFQGIKVPTKRRIYARDDQNQKVAEPLLVAIDITDITLS